MASPILSGSILVLCEGKTDKEFLDWIVGSAQLARFVVHSTSGKDLTADRDKSILNSSDYFGKIINVLVVFDADKSSEASRKQIEKCLVEAATGLPFFSYMLPDDQSIGELEDLCLQAFTDTALLACAESFLGCARALNPDIPKSSKKTFRAAMTIKKESGSDPYMATKLGLIDFENEKIQKLVQFLKSPAPDG